MMADADENELIANRHWQIADAREHDPSLASVATEAEAREIIRHNAKSRLWQASPATIAQVLDAARLLAARLDEERSEPGADLALVDRVIREIDAIDRRYRRNAYADMVRSWRRLLRFRVWRVTVYVGWRR